MEPSILNRPTYSVEVSFTDPKLTPVWQDITSRVRKTSITRGRESEMSRIEAGTAQVTLDNQDRRFDPTYTAGPYYGVLLPMRPLRIRATWEGITYDVFRGFIEDWGQEWPVNRDVVVKVRAVDGFAVLAGTKVTADYPEQRVDERIGMVLDDASWTTGDVAILNIATLDAGFRLGPGGDRSLDRSVSRIQSVSLEGRYALEHLQEAQEVENGMVFISKDGAVAFHNRLRHYASQAPTVVFGDGAELPFVDLKFAYDIKDVWNEIIISMEGGQDHIAVDATSQGHYFTRTLERKNLLIARNSEWEAQARAEWFLWRYKDARLKIREVTIEPQSYSNPQFWHQVLARELGDCIRVIKRPTGTISPIDQVGFIEGIEIDIDPARWRYTFRCSVGSLMNYAQLDISSLDAGALAY